eukprot:6193208-Pleurochrysis_carterae.AAC.4
MRPSSAFAAAGVHGALCQIRRLHLGEHAAVCAGGARALRGAAPGAWARRRRRQRQMPTLLRRRSRPRRGDSRGHGGGRGCDKGRRGGRGGDDRRGAERPRRGRDAEARRVLEQAIDKMNLLYDEGRPGCNPVADP